MSLNITKIIFLNLLLICQVYGQKLSVVAIGDAQIERSNIVFLLTKVEGRLNRIERKKLEEILNLFHNDFAFYRKRFQVLKPNVYIKKWGDPDFSYWQKKKIDVVVKTRFFKSESFGFHVKAYSIREKKLFYDQTFSIASAGSRELGHKVSDHIYKRLTARRSIFNSKILFVSNRHGTRRNPIKELFIMDFDGRNKKRLTYHRGTVISPAISYDGKKVIYSLIPPGARNRNINLYLFDLNTMKYRLLSSKKGINSGAVFTPDGKNIVLTLSHQGNAEIYKMNLNGGNLERLTQHYAPDVDPSLNRNGSLMTFLSGRPGPPMIYTADPRGKEKGVKRIGYVGKFNATPRFNPNGTEIAFSSWMDNRFDIFRLDSNGNNLYRLTKDFGSNEDPTYSPDGQFLAFSNQKVLSRTRAVHNIYIMDREGEILGQVTKNFGNCITPRWSK